MLLQRNDSSVENVAVYASNSRAPFKQNNAVTEEECLEVVWAVEKIRPYLYGHHLVWPVTIFFSAGSPGLGKASSLEFAGPRVSFC